MPSGQKTDEELMHRLASAPGRRKEESFTQLFQRYAKPLFEYFNYMFRGNKEKAEDFVHDLFAKIIEKPESFSPGKKFRYWVFSVASNMCKNEFRSLSVRYNYENEKHTAETHNVEATGFSEIKLALAGLKPETRNVILLKYKFGLSVREISGILEIPEGTVKSRLFYGIKSVSHIIQNKQHELWKKKNIYQ